MEIRRQFDIDAPPEQVWAVIGQQFDQVDRWASSVFESTAQANGIMPDGAPMAGRTCRTEMGPFREAIVEFDEGRRVVSYDASGEKMPFFVRKLNNHWTVSSAGSGRSRVDMRLTGDLVFPFSVVMGPLMRRQFARVVDLVGEELSHYVETGTPHPRKVAAERKARLGAA